MHLSTIKLKSRIKIVFLSILITVGANDIVSVSISFDLGSDIRNSIERGFEVTAKIEPGKEKLNVSCKVSYQASI